MDIASALLADRVTASLAARVWSFGAATQHGCHAFLLVHGSGVLCIAQQVETELTGPALVWLPQPVRGSVKVHAGGHGYTLSIAEPFLQRTASDPMLGAHRQPFMTQFTLIPAALLTAKLDVLVASMEALVEESHEMAQGASAALGLHLGVVLLHLWRCAGLQDKQGRSGQSTVERFSRLIELHYREGLRIGDFAERLGVSHGHLHEACMRIGGMTPLAMLHERIIEEARARLRQNEVSVEQVGYSLGFRDPGYFNRFFKRMTGQSPGAFQRSTGARKRQAPSTFASWP
jgi:AraC family transcriptional activator of pobA